SVRYFMSADWQDETGRMKIPEFDKRWLSSRNISLRPEQENPNYLSRIAVRGNFDIDVAESATVTVSAGYTDQLLRLPRSDDSGVPGLATNVYGGPGYKYMFNA